MILVVGATGELGGLIARTLLDSGEEVRILQRPGSNADGLVHAGAKPVQGDLKDAASLWAACAGVDTVITTANAVGRGGDDTIESVDRQGNRNLIEAAAGAGVDRFIFISALGAAPDNPIPLLQAKGETEQALRESGMTWTILQPNLYMELWIPFVVGGPVLAGAPVTLVGEGRRMHSMVSRSDVAAFAVAALEREEARGQTLVIGGPQPISWRDIVGAFERTLGRDIPIRTLPLGEQLPGYPPAVNELLTAIATYDSPIDMSEVSSLYGVTQTTLDGFVQGFVAASAPRDA